MVKSQFFPFTDGVHKRRVHVEAANPYDYFAYRWAPGDPGLGGGDLSDIPTTLVEFFIEELESGTKVTVKESGFASLPSDYVESAFKENTGGWGFVMERFETMLNSF
ncbi:MAG: SRPBCC domain-containing protein [Actinomycetota bacterium]